MRTEMDDFTGESKKLMKSAAFIISGRQDMSLMDKLGILADAAKYDVACTSTGVQHLNKSEIAAGRLKPVFFGQIFLHSCVVYIVCLCYNRLEVINL